MLSFLRHIRQKLLEDNRFNKYLLYVIIEVIIVIIGILIAIRVDNWNEDRIGAEETTHLFKEVNDELVQNIENLDRIINILIQKDTFYFKVLEQGVQYKDYKASYLLFSFPLIYDRTSLVDDDFKELVSKKNKLTRLQDSLFSELKELYGTRKTNTDIDDETIHKTQLAFRDKLMNEQPWFSSFMERDLTDEMIQYALTDPFYRNQLHEMRFREEWYLQGILWFRTKALDLYVAISEMLNTEKDYMLVDIKDFEEVKGVYTFGDGAFKVTIRGKDKLFTDVYINDSLAQEWDNHPFSETYLISYRQGKGAHFLTRIEFGKNGEVLGLRNFGDNVIVDGKRRMWKKIE